MRSSIFWSSTFFPSTSKILPEMRDSLFQIMVVVLKFFHRATVPFFSCLLTCGTGPNRPGWPPRDSVPR